MHSLVFMALRSANHRSNNINKSRSQEESETNVNQIEKTERSNEDDGEGSWVRWFCEQEGNELFCQVEDTFIVDEDNLVGLSTQVPCYDYALDMILDVQSSPDEFTEEQNELVEWAGEMLYGLVHARYILTTQGMAAMVEKYRNYDFGTCPRAHCGKQRCLPVGESDTPRSKTVKIYCPKCEDMYTPHSGHKKGIDGAYFGTTFAHLFFLNYEHLRPQKARRSYVPRIHGFKISK